MAEAGASRDNEEDHSDDPHAEFGQGAEDQTSIPPKANIMDEVCPITDKNEKPFRLMDLPPEIRIEIYRACLTRPFDILLSREPKPVEVEKERSRTREDRGSYVELTGPPEDDITVVDSQDVHGSPSRATHTIGIRSRRAIRALARSRNSTNHTAHAQDLTDPHTPQVHAQNPDDAATPQANVTFSTHDRPIPDPQLNNAPRRRTTTATITSVPVLPPRTPRPQDVDPLLVKLLSTSKLVYKEARAILYGENNFMLDLDTAQPTLAALHQRSRGQIKYLRVTIPTHNEILERFAEVVRLSLRYCWRLKLFVVHMPFVLPGAEGSSTSGNTTVYANAFDILRWLPKQAEVVLEGNVCEEIRRVVEKNSNLAKSLDEVSFVALLSP